MSSPGTPGLPEMVDKGKRRATEPTERTPLLVPSLSHHDEVQPAADSVRRLRRRLTMVFLVSLSACVIVFGIFAALALSYASRASILDPETVIHQQLAFSGPDRIEVLNVSRAGIWLNIRGNVGVDAGKVIGVASDPEDGLFRFLWKAFGRWSVRTLDQVTVNMTSVRITLDDNSTESLIDLDIPPLELPLTVDPPDDRSWLTPLSTSVFVRPTSNSTLLLGFLKESWRTGKISVHVHVGSAIIRGGALQEVDWRNKLSRKLSNIRTSIDMKLPSIPGFPSPGRNMPFPSVSELVTLTSFDVSTQSSLLALHGVATAINPAPSGLDFSVPSLPFDVSLIDKIFPSVPPVHIASVATSPVELTYPNITLSIHGVVPPISASAAPILSNFISRYLAAVDNQVLISSPLLFPGLSAEATFPAPNPRPRVLRNVTIKHMRIRPGGNSFFASGTVQALIVLPRGFDVSIDISFVLPEVLVFDGEIPAVSYEHNLRDGRRHQPPDELPPDMPLPNPIPKGAFGHIKPRGWLASHCVPVKPDSQIDGPTYAISAKVEDVPLEVLPGRQREFGNFVKKVIFGTGGAAAGILGNAAAAVNVKGLPLSGTPDHDMGEVVLERLPFRGSVHVERKGLLEFDSGDEDDKSDKKKESEIQKWKKIWSDILKRIKRDLPF